MVHNQPNTCLNATILTSHKKETYSKQTSAYPKYLIILIIMSLALGLFNDPQ